MSLQVSTESSMETYVKAEPIYDNGDEPSTSCETNENRHNFAENTVATTSSPATTTVAPIRIKTEIGSTVDPQIANLTLLLGPATLGEFTTELSQSNDCFILKDNGKKLYSVQRYTESNALLHNTLDAETAELIASTYTKVTEFHILAKRATEEIWSPFANLLHSWGSRLTALRLRLYETEGPSEAVFNVLNTSLPSLDHLTLWLNQTECPQLPILGQLKEFNFWSNCTKQPYIPISLRRYAEANHTITRIHCRLERTNTRELFALSPRLRGLFSSICDAFLPMYDVIAVTVLFPNLTELNIKQPVSLRTLFNSLATLTRLRYFSLEIDFNQLEPDELKIPLTQVPAVKEVTLWISMHSHLQLHLLQLYTTVPNIQVLSVNFSSGCVACGVEQLDEANPKYAKQTIVCLRKVFTALGEGCVHLRKRFHGEEEWLD